MPGHPGPSPAVGAVARITPAQVKFGVGAAVLAAPKVADRFGQVVGVAGVRLIVVLLSARHRPRTLATGNDTALSRLRTLLAAPRILGLPGPETWSRSTLRSLRLGSGSA